jgi:hypothetical protein
MTPTLFFLAGLGLTLGAGLTVAIYLRRHLQNLLADLCGTVERGAFWTAFSNVTLVLLPLIAALSRRPIAGDDALAQLATQLQWALAGLAGAVLAIGVVIGRFIPRPYVPLARRPMPIVPQAGSPDTGGSASSLSPAQP